MRCRLGRLARPSMTDPIHRPSMLLAIVSAVAAVVACLAYALGVLR